MQATHPLIGAALRFLVSQWPVAVSFETLLGAARAAATTEVVNAAEIMASTLATAYRIGFVELQISPPEVTNRVSEHPLVSRLARLQLEHGDSATNQSHLFIKFPDPLRRRLVQLLDGTRNREALTRDLIEYVRSGHGTVLEDGVRIENMAEVEVILERCVREGLESLAREGMLVG